MRKLLIFMGITSSGLSAFGQCFPDRHNTSWNEVGTSCEVQPNPNKEREAGHWISYDFGNTYRLGEAHIWNINAPEILNQGFREFHIDYSTDGNAWKNLGFYTINQASGLSTYEGESIGSFSGDTTRFVLLTEESNWGGACSGLAELRIEGVEIVARLNSIASGDCFKASIYPNPHSGSFNFGLQSAVREPFIMHFTIIQARRSGLPMRLQAIDSFSTKLTPEHSPGACAT